jgi:hypothetical protein
MPHTIDNVLTTGESSQPQLPLKGSIVYDIKPSGTYARHLVYETIDGVLKRHHVNLGRVIDGQQGLFRNLERGYFTFSLEKGYGEASAPQALPLNALPPHVTLHFGDIWMLDQIYKQTGLEPIFNNLLPEDSDTLKSLLSYKILVPQASCYAAEWYTKSYARILYPAAMLDSARISDFHAKIVIEKSYHNFFSSYISLITNDYQYNKAVPILIDSTGLPNDIKTYLTAVNNHNGLISNEIRLIYVIDKITKLPIFFRYVTGNIIDNSTLINTINQLITYNLDIELVVMDAGYYSENNLRELIASNISFITRMTINRKEYKQLISEYGSNLTEGKNAISYGKRCLFGKIVPIDLYGTQLYAYIMYDPHKAADDINKIVIENSDNKDKDRIIDEKLLSVGKFILLSSKKYELNDILPLYYSRQQIEQVFDLSKTFLSLLPLRAHSEETIRGVLLISFIASIVYSIISNKLSNSNYHLNRALYLMNQLQIDILESAQIVKELTKQQKEIFNLLSLECPFSIETGTILNKDSFISSLKSTNKKRGRPKGSKNKNKSDLPIIIQRPEVQRKRGRPKGSKNQTQKLHVAPLNSDSEEKRKRGRPKGSKNLA